MGLIAKSEGGTFEQVEPGTYSARCYGVIDIGTQRNEWQGETKHQHQVIIQWELPEELMNDGRPFGVSKFYTLSLHEKANLCGDLQAWRGREFTEEEKKGFDISKLVGVPCMLSVIHNQQGKARVQSVMKLPKGMVVPDQVNESVLFDLDAYICGDTKTWDKLSDGIKGIILKAKEFDKVDDFPPEGSLPNDIISDDIPF